MVQRWKQKAAFREGLRTVGRQTLLITGVAGLYFGTELGVGLWREQQGDWANTAAAGALAGGVLGSRGELQSGGFRGEEACGVEWDSWQSRASRWIHQVCEIEWRFCIQAAW